VIPLPHKRKGPILEGWQSLVLSDAELAEHFSGRWPTNFGLLLGDVAQGLVDIDLDDPTAVALAPDFLPTTGAVFGRASNPRSHWLYRAPGLATKKFEDTQATLVEIRSTGCQTMAPGSTHPGGEPVRWNSEGEPAPNEPEALARCAARLAACCLLARHWPGAKSKQRHDTALALSGTLLQSDWTVEEAEHFMKHVVRAAGDDELKDRLGTVRDTAKALEQGEPVTGLGKLKELISPQVVAKMARWLDLAAAKAPARQDCTDTANGERFARDHGRELRYCYKQRAWYAWDGARWQPDARGDVERRAMATARGILTEVAAQPPSKQVALTKHSIRSQDRSRLEAMAWAARPELAISPDEFDPDPWLLNCRNGTLDLRTGELHPHDRDAYLTKLVPVDYRADATCPRWTQFLGEVMGDDADMVGFLQRMVGYALTGSTGEQCFFLLHGGGANGKSTFVETLGKMLGDYARPTEFRTLEARKSSDAVRNDLAALRGLRLVTSVEVGRHKRLDEALVKQLTGSDTITARFLYGEFFDFRPEFKLFLAANNKPVVQGTDEGIWRRVKLVPFEVTIPPERRDRALGAALLAELPGILAWAVQGCLRWQSAGLQPPARVNAATEEYRQESDSLGDFLNTECERGPGLAVAAADLYHAYERWAENSGVDALAANVFGMAMKERGFWSGSEHDPAKRKTVRRYRGVCLKPRQEYAVPAKKVPPGMDLRATAYTQPDDWR